MESFSTTGLILSSQDGSSPRKRWILTFSLYFMYLSYGAGVYVLSPTLLDLAKILHVSFKEISVGVTLMWASYCPAALIFGFLFSGVVNRQLALVGCSTIYGGLTLSIPFLRSLTIYNLVQAGLGIVQAGLDVGGNAWILEMWGGDDRLSMVMQGYHFCYAIGMTVSPLITAHFLLPESQGDNSTIEVDTMVDGVHPWSFHGYGKEELFLSIPFVMATGVIWTSAITLFVLFFRLPYQQTKRQVTEVNKSSPSGHHKDCQCGIGDNTCEVCVSNSDVHLHQMPKSYLIKVVILGSLLFTFYPGIEVNSFTFLPDFAYYSDLHLSKKTGALMLALMAGTYAVGRAISIFVASKVRTVHMLYSYLTLIGIGNGILFVFGNKSEIGLWVASIVMGFGYSCVIPTIYSFLEERINVTNAITGCFVFSSATATITSPILIGIFIESTPMVFSYVNCISLTACWIIYLSLHSTDRLITWRK